MPFQPEQGYPANTKFDTPIVLFVIVVFTCEVWPGSFANTLSSRTRRSSSDVPFPTYATIECYKSSKCSYIPSNQSTRHTPMQLNAFEEGSLSFFLISVHFFCSASVWTHDIRREAWTAVLTMEMVVERYDQDFETWNLFEKVFFLIKIRKASKHTFKCFFFVCKNVGALLLRHATVAVAHRAKNVKKH